MNKMLDADDFVLMNDTIERLREKFLKWKKTFEKKALNISLTKTKVILSALKGEDVPSVARR